MSDESYDYTPKSPRGGKDRPSAPPAPREAADYTPRPPRGGKDKPSAPPAPREAADYTPRPPRRAQAGREAGKARLPARKKGPAARPAKKVKVGSLLRSRAFMAAAGILGLVVLLGSSLVALLPGGGAGLPTGSPVDQGNYYYDRALDLWYNGDYNGAETALQQAASSYEQALAQNPEDAQVRTDLGAVYFYQSRLLSDDTLLLQAIQTWTVALQYEPDKTETLFNLGLGYADMGEVDQAIAMWQRVIEVAPGSEAALNAAQLIQDYGGAVGP